MTIKTYRCETHNGLYSEYIFKRSLKSSPLSSSVDEPRKIDGFECWLTPNTQYAITNLSKRANNSGCHYQ